jgi:WD40 repeat protein
MFMAALDKSFKDIHVFCGETHVRLGVLSGHTESIMNLHFSPDNTKLASCGHDKSVRIWDLGSFTEIMKLPCEAFVNYVRFNSSGDILYFNVGNKFVGLWDTRSNEVRREKLEKSFYFVEDDVHLAEAVGFSRSVTSSRRSDGFVRIYDSSGEQEFGAIPFLTQGGHSTYTHEPFGQFIVCTHNEDKSVEIFDVAACCHRVSLSLPEAIYGAIVSTTDYRYVSLAGHGKAECRSAETGELLSSVTMPPGNPYNCKVLFRSDRKQCAVVTGKFGNELKITILDVETDSCICTIPDCGNLFAYSHPSQLVLM